MLKNTTSDHDQFKHIVAIHVQEALRPDEWRRLRALAIDRRRYADKSAEANPTADASELLNEAISEDSIAVAEVLAAWPSGRADVVGAIAGQPVYYLNGRGVYLWGLEPNEARTLMFWISHPAYPPGW